MEKTYKCKFCNKEFKSGQSLGAHVINCKSNPNNYQKKFAKKRSKKAKINNPVEEHLLVCPICNKEFTIKVSKKDFDKGKYPHTCSRSCASKLSNQKADLENKNKKISESLKNKKKEKIKIEKHIEGTCEYCGKKFFKKEITRNRISQSKFCSKECIKKYISEKAKEMGYGGLRENAYKKYKSGIYHGIHCDSSWELAFLVYCEEHNISIKRCKKSLQYTYKNKLFKYYPDFVINETMYEIKGYENDKAKEKHRQHPEVIYLDKDKMQKYLIYVIDKYGKNFITLYDRLDKR